MDGFAFPPAHLIQKVIGTREIAWYQLGGLFMHQSITSMLRKNGIVVESLASILDFGCGCGRIIRWWAALKDRCEIWGTDYDPELIKWCQKELSSFASFNVNVADPPLSFPDGKFEFLYSYSVLTHIAIHKQKPWIAELARVVKPGGYVLLTTHGQRVAIRNRFPEEWLMDLEEKGMIALNEDKSGSNVCSVFHSESFMSNLDEFGLKMIDYLPGGVRDSSEQDIYLYTRL